MELNENLCELLINRMNKCNLFANVETQSEYSRRTNVNPVNYQLSALLGKWFIVSPIN